jgi:ATP-binding cassette subfamily C (CFTR/MRP) protein 4
VGIYGGLVLGLLIMSMLRAIWFILGMMRASQRLHDSIFIHVMRAPVLFFDTNPIGRILNRFSKDLGFIDQLLPYTYLDFIQLAVRAFKPGKGG